MRASLLILCFSLLSLGLPGFASAEAASPSRLMLRAGAGGGYTFIETASGGDDYSPKANGYQGAWDLAAGLALKPWFALHATSFGSVAPNARTDSEYERHYGSLTIGALGAGVTFRAPWGGYVSPSVGAALLKSSNMSGPRAAGAAELLTGWDVAVTDSLRLGLALQIVTFVGRPLSTEYLQGAGASGLLTLSFANPL